MKCTCPRFTCPTFQSEHQTLGFKAQSGHHTVDGWSILNSTVMSLGFSWENHSTPNKPSMGKAIQNQQELSGGLIWASLDLRLNIHKGLKRKALRFLSACLCAQKETQMAEKQIPEEAYTETHWCVWRGWGSKTEALRGIFTAGWSPNLPFSHRSLSARTHTHKKATWGSNRLNLWCISPSKITTYHLCLQHNPYSIFIFLS